MAYSPPVNVLDDHRKNKENNSNNLFACPANTGMFKNTYVIKHQFDNEFSLPKLKDYHLTKYPLDTESLISVSIDRPSSIQGYYNIRYNMGWLFFANEPLVARFTPPYMPLTSPANGAMLSCGEFDIGSWYRSFNLDYHLPIPTTGMSFKENDPLMYVEFKTDKKVVLKRYTLSKKLQSLSLEAVNSPKNYGRFKTLKERYLMASKAQIPEQILAEIKKNLIE